MIASALNSKCRTCLCESTTYRQLQDCVEENWKIVEMLDGVVPQIDIKNCSKFSTLICQICVEKLLTSYKFQQLCIESNKQLNIGLFETEKFTDGLDQQMKQESIIPLHEPQSNKLSDDDDRSDTDSSNEQLSLIKERLVKENTLSDDKLENCNGSQQSIAVKGTVCTICDKDFRYISKLKEHMPKHSGESPFLCAQCGKTFRRARNLKSHLQLHTGEKSFVCSECGHAYRDLSHFREHMARHAGNRKYQCPKCPSRFYRKADVIRHCKSERVHANFVAFKKVNNLPDDCNKFADVHKLNDKKIEEPKMQFTLQSPDSSECSEQKAMLALHHTVQHRKSVFAEKTDDLNDNTESISNGHERSDDNSEKVIFSKYEAKEIKNNNFIGTIHINEVDKSMKKDHYACESCGKIFPKLFLLKRHSSVHSPARPYTCEICKYRFTSPQNLKAHLSKHKNGTIRNSKHVTFNKNKIKPLCSVCGKEYANNYNLKEHMRLHSGDKPFQCSVCGKAFRYSSALKEHMRVHSGEYPYQCLQCGKVFRHSSSFNRHRDKHQDLQRHQSSNFLFNSTPVSRLPNQRPELHLEVENLEEEFSQIEHQEMDKYSQTIDSPILPNTSNAVATRKTDQENYSISNNGCNEIFEVQEFLEVHKEEDDNSVEGIPKVTVKEEIEVSSQIFEVSMINNETECETKDYDDSKMFQECTNDWNSDSKWTFNGYEDSNSSDNSEKFAKNETRLIDVLDGNRNKTNDCNKKKYGNLRPHMEIPTDLEKYQCTQCTSHFTSVLDLTHHRKKMHCMVARNNKLKELMHKCTQCNKSFNGAISLREHMKEYMLLRKFQCPECFRPFKCKSDLINHQREIHRLDIDVSNFVNDEGENMGCKNLFNFPCPDCPKHFNDQHSLSIHYKTHAKELKDNKFEAGTSYNKKFTSLHKLQENPSESTIEMSSVQVKEEIEAYEEGLINGTEWLSTDYKNLYDNSAEELHPKIETDETKNYNIVESDSVGGIEK